MTTRPSANPARPSQLFVRLWNTVATREEAQVRENFFSECVAGVLNADPLVARDFAARLNGGRDRIQGTSISRADIRVIPQYSCRSRGRQCYVDLRLEIGRVAIGVEVKLDAPEGVLPSGDRQIDKYLQIKNLTHVAYVTGYHTVVQNSVLQRRARYLRPRNRDHFLWSDFYSLFLAASKRRTAPQLHQALIELFHARHLEPSHPELPDLSTVEGRSGFRPFWKLTRRKLARRYDIVAPTRINATTYAWSYDYSNAWKIAIEPAFNPGLLRVWLYMQTRPARDEGVKKLRRLFGDDPMFFGATVEPRTGSGVAKAGISVWIPYRTMFPRRSSDQTKQIRAAEIIDRIIVTVNGPAERDGELRES
jgi:hypothetical protein